jgi:hypothetical protein
MPRTTNLVPIALVFAACASQHIQMRIPQEITTRTSATITADSGASGVSLHCDENATVLEKDGYTVFFPGHRGYRGAIGERWGHVVVGAVELHYDDAGFTFSGPLGRGHFEPTDSGGTLEIDQTGAARSH